MKASAFPLFLLFLSSQITYLLALPLIITSPILFFHGYVYNNSAILILSFTLSALLVAWQFRWTYAYTLKQLLYHLFGVALIVALCTLAVGKVYDKSWDGMTYHQMTVLHLIEGWNPYYEELPEASMRSEYTGRSEDMNLYVNHYAKGTELFGAVVMAATGNIESGKVFNILLMLAAVGASYYLLNKVGKKDSPWNFVIAATAGFNPIAVNQVFSYLVDGALASALVILICNLVLVLLSGEKNKPWIYVNLFFLTVLIANIKFTGIGYLAAIYVVFVCACMLLKKMNIARKFLIAGAISAFVAAFVVGFNPYFRNAYFFGHPFYPVAGSDEVDIMIHVMPPEFRSDNTLQKFAKSTFSRCDNFDSVQPDRYVQLKLPFTFSIDEIKMFQSETTRLSGFGVLWSGILCLSAILAVVLIGKLRGDERRSFVLLTSVILLSVAINPESWWARLIPQLWLFPIVVASVLLTNSGRNRYRAIAKGILIGMVLNSFLVALPYTYSTLITTMRTNRYLTALKNSTNPAYAYFDIFEPNTRKFEDRDIRYIRVPTEESLPCDRKASFLNITVCPP